MPPTDPPSPLRRGAVVLVAAIPAAGAAWAAHQVLGTFDAMTRYQGEVGNGHGGLATVAAVFNRANASVLAALILGAALATFLRLALRRSPAAAIPATRLSIVAACLAGLPAALVYAAESGVLAAFSPGAVSSVTAATEQLRTLLWAAVACGLGVALLGVVAAIRARKAGAVVAGAAPWLLASVLLLALAGVFASRGFTLDALAKAAVAH